MTHKIIKVDNYLLVVDDSEIKDCYYWNELDQEIRKNNNINHPYHKKIIAHLPLNGSPILEAVDLLPPYSRHQEDGLEEYFREEHQQAIKRCGQMYDAGYYEGLHDGYNKAREKYKYTEEDVRKVIEMAREEELVLYTNNEYSHTYTESDIIASMNIQSLHQYPTEFECEMEDYGYYEMGVDNFIKHGEKPKTITTAQGRQWVGKYK